MSPRMPLLIAVTALGPIAWGTTYANTTEFLPEGAPMLTALLRALPAGLILLAITRTLPKGQWWWKAAVLGVLNVGAIQPLIVVALAARLVGERVTAVKLAAGIAGVAGVALLVLTPAAKLDVLGVAAALGGAALMAVGVTLTKAWGPAVPPLTLTAWQLTAWGAVPAAHRGLGGPT